ALIIRMLDEVPADVETTFQALLCRRQQREPVAYIVGEKEFWSRTFQVDANVLIPRPETEHLIEALLKRYTDRLKSYRFCDIGTGSGSIACTIACEFPNAEIVATDISTSALAIASINAERLNVADRVTLKCGDMFAALDDHTEPFDAIISNPPYVSRDEMEALEPELKYEPRSALTDEDDGKRFLSTLLNECHTWLKPGGYIMVETGLCGLPNPPEHLKISDIYRDLAGMKRGGVYHYKSD
ncbi:MAG TPA: peptide chain release factor N(5)-glutamine methyltransferase, partial [Mariprofundaceae bacterium]|nr:peptide chain release factor N(5)-glutamine methyltransferase [Mariprofundaceae bacterium]